MLLTDFFENEYRPRRLVGKSHNSVRLCRLSIAAFGKTLGRPAMVDDLTNENVLRHMQTRLEGVLFAGKSRGTANKDRTNLLAMWRMACRLGMLKKWPEVPALTEPERIPKAWTQDDLRKLFSAIDRMEGSVSNVPAALWWRGLVMLALDTAERIGAVVTAEWEWFEERWIHIPAEVRKGGRRDRKYWLSPMTADIIDRIRSTRADRKCVFPWARNLNSLWSEYGEILKSAGLPHGRQDKFHRLRKTTASVIFAAGGNPQESLDHQHRRTTRRYIDPRFSRETHPSDYMTQYLSNPPTPPPPRRSTG